MIIKENANIYVQNTFRKDAPSLGTKRTARKVLKHTILRRNEVDMAFNKGRCKVVTCMKIFVRFWL